MRVTYAQAFRVQATFAQRAVACTIWELHASRIPNVRLSVASPALRARALRAKSSRYAVSKPAMTKLSQRS